MEQEKIEPMEEQSPPAAEPADTQQEQVSPQEETSSAYQEAKNRLQLGEHPNPRDILNRIESFTKDVGSTFHGILDSLEQLSVDIKQLDNLKEVASMAESMLAGQRIGHLEIEAKGEVGKLVHAINRTIDNLQQLDQTVHKETGKVPELAEHLDHIAAETESATQQVLEKLDSMIEGSEKQTNALQALQEMSQKRLELDKDFKEQVDKFIKSLSESDDQQTILQEAMEFVAFMGGQAQDHMNKSKEVQAAITDSHELAEHLLNHTFDIMNLLQFQDITRQKVSKVIGLLKDMQEGLYRLLRIFNIQSEGGDNVMEVSDLHKATQDRILERDALKSDTHVESVDDIIASFNKN